MIAVIAIYVAYRQWRTAQNKLKLDLFDRQFTIYLAAKKAIVSVIESGKITNEEADKFLLETREAQWLLDKDIDMYFRKTIYPNGGLLGEPLKGAIKP